MNSITLFSFTIWRWRIHKELQTFLIKSITSGSPCSSGFFSSWGVDVASAKQRKGIWIDGASSIALRHTATADRIANIKRDMDKNEEESWLIEIGSIFGRSVSARNNAMKMGSCYPKCEQEIFHSLLVGVYSFALSCFLPIFICMTGNGEEIDRTVGCIDGMERHGGYTFCHSGNWNHNRILQLTLSSYTWIHLITHAIDNHIAQLREVVIGEETPYRTVANYTCI